MPQISAFDRHFSQAEQAKLAAWLDANPAISVDDFRELLAERGLQVGRTTAHKEKKRIEDLGRQLRQSREQMDALAEGLEDRDDSKRGRALLELARTLTFKCQAALVGREDGEISPKEVREINVSLHNLFKAMRDNQEFAVQEERRKAVDEAADRAGKAMAKRGLSGDTAAAIRAAIEGAE